MLKTPDAAETEALNLHQRDVLSSTFSLTAHRSTVKVPMAAFLDTSTISLLGTALTDSPSPGCVMLLYGQRQREPALDMR